VVLLQESLSLMSYSQRLLSSEITQLGLDLCSLPNLRRQKMILPTASAAPRPLQVLPSPVHNVPAFTASTATRPLQTMTASAQNVAAPGVAAGTKRKADVIDLTEDDPIQDWR
jgi:hypothetical protein